MIEQHYNYQRIAQAIEYIRTHRKEQPSLDQIAEHVHLSPFHFQRMFTEWAGVSPKKFIQYLSVEHAKSILGNKQSSLFETAHQTGLSGTGRLHDLFVNLEGMTPGDFKNGGINLSINYSFADSPFGEVLIASTPKGICHMAFVPSQMDALEVLKKRFPKAQYQQMKDKYQEEALFIFQHDWSRLHDIKLHLQGTPFQLKVWKSLLTIPLGNLSTYGAIAKQIGKPNASRAVGTAIGSNPVAFLIPCHRVIQSTGQTGGYMWGPTRKSAILGWESAKLNQ